MLSSNVREFLLYTSFINLASRTHYGTVHGSLYETEQLVVSSRSGRVGSVNRVALASVGNDEIPFFQAGSQSHRCFTDRIHILK